LNKFVSIQETLLPCNYCGYDIKKKPVSSFSGDIVGPDAGESGRTFAKGNHNPRFKGIYSYAGSGTKEPNSTKVRTCDQNFKPHY